MVSKISKTTEPITCDCCGGCMPPYYIWEANRDQADDCTGAVHLKTLRCRAWVRDELWQIDEDESEGNEE